MDEALAACIVNIMVKHWDEENQELDVVVSTGFVVNEDTGLYHGLIVFGGDQSTALYDPNARATSQEAQNDAEMAMRAVGDIFSQLLGGEDEVETEVTEISAN